MRKSIAMVMAAALCGSAAAVDVNPEWSIARQWNEENLFAIRRSTPRPPVHARNLYHVDAAMYDAWTAYDTVGRGVFFTEKHSAADVPAARREAISYAAYRILKARYKVGNGPNIAEIQADLDVLFAALGYDKNFTSTIGDTPAPIGNRIASIILAAGLLDGSNEANNYAPIGYVYYNIPLIFRMPGTVMNEPDRWQPLAFSFLVLGNGELIGVMIQVPVCPHWKVVTPFAMNLYDRTPPNNLYFDQGPPPVLGTEAMREEALAVLERSSALDTNLGRMQDISPTSWGNCELGSYEQIGYSINPITGMPYEPNVVNVADYARASAEFWADGTDVGILLSNWTS